MERFEKRCHKLGISIRVFRLISSRTPESLSGKIEDLLAFSDLTDITAVIVGGPKGLYLASHHEKLLLIDSECIEHAAAFVGGYDIARGRYDQSSHPLPKPIVPSAMQMTSASNQLSSPVRNRPIPVIVPGVKLLWHDVQLLVRGNATQQLRLHFNQRWIHSFTRNTPLTRSQTLSIPAKESCDKLHSKELSNSASRTVYSNCRIRVLRIWKGVFDTHYLFHEYQRMISGAKSFLYLEHQYPFHNYPLTYFMCQALQQNPNLLLLIVTPVKTDLLTGFVGNFVDWSQDHIIQHLQIIKKAAPERVGIYGLVQQDESTSRIKPIYVHSKLAIIDDEWVLTGSTNMDNMSFFYSSELSLTISNDQLARETRIRLVKEHLGRFYKPEMDNDFRSIFDAFQQVAIMNDKCLRNELELVGRPVLMAPSENYELVLKRIYYPNKISKLLYKMGINTEDFFQNLAESGKQLTDVIGNWKPLSLLRSRL